MQHYISPLISGLHQKKFTMAIIVFLCVITGLQVVASEASSVCMADCTGLLTPRPSSLYEQYCCIPSNNRKTFTVKENDQVKMILCPSTIPTSCSKYMYNSCNALLQAFPAATSGYYNVSLSNGSIITVYCDMEGSNCDDKGGWMRVGYLNMSESGTSCPSGLTLREFNNIDHDLCGRPMSSSIFYSSHGIHYSKVCGQLRGYQFGEPDAFPPLHNSNAIPNIDNCSTYVDGVTFTYGSNPRKHIWTYACGARENVLGDNYLPPYICPCNNDSNGTYIPEWIGSDHYCESGLYSTVSNSEVLFSNDILWDGQHCNGNEGPCCTNPKMPWFIKTLNEATTEDIELRMCGNESPSNNEDTPLDIIELYIR